MFKTQKKADWASELMNWYLKQLLIETTQDAKLQSTVDEVLHLVKSPLALFHPEIVLRVIKSMILKTIFTKRQTHADINNTLLDINHDC